MSFYQLKAYGYVLWSFIEKHRIGTALGTPEGDIPRSFDGVFMDAVACENGWMAVAALAFCAILGYLLGSINFAVIISKFYHSDDVRAHGSGNAGATNMLRTYGKKAGILTFVLDGVKAAVSVIAAMLLMGTGGAYVAGLFCILGHIFPVYHKFRGGKGVVVAAVTILVLEPIVFVCLVILFVVIVAWSKFISLGSIICAFFFPLLQNAFYQGQGFIATVIAVLIAVIVIVMHRANIKRLLNRTENKFSFSKKGAK